MRYIVALFIISFIAVSCGTTQEVEPVKPVPAKELPPRQTAESPPKKPAFDVEKLLAYLALSEEKEAEFLNMWNSTTSKMRQARAEFKDDRFLMREKLTEVKAERDEGLRAILSEAELAEYYKYMAENRPRIGASRSERRRGGN